MTLWELSIFSAIGIVMAFTLGFLFGTGCQAAEDRRAMRKMSDHSKKALREMTKASLKAIDKAYELGKNWQKAEASKEWDRCCDDLMAQIKGTDSDIKFGGF